MSDTFTTIIISFFIALGSAFSGWFFGRKRQNLENIDMALGTWQKVIDSLENRVSVQLDKIDKFAKENDDLRNECLELKKEICRLKKENGRLLGLAEKVKHYEKLLTDNNIKH